MVKNQKPFTEEEDNYLRENYGSKTIKELCTEMGRTKHSVNNRIARLNLRDNTRIRSYWTGEEDSFLKEYINKLTMKEIAERLGKTTNSVSSRIRILDLRKEPVCRRWTEEEDEYILKYYGVRPLEVISKKLKRTPEAIENRMTKISSGGARGNSECITSYELAREVGVDVGSVYRWAKTKGLEYETIKTNNAEFMAFNVESFWKWAENNKELINFNKIEKNALLPEPAWVDEQRKLDFYHRPQKEKQAWTKEEDERLWHLFYQQGLTQKEIGDLMGRSANGIQRRLSRIRKQRSSKKTA